MKNSEWTLRVERDEALRRLKLGEFAIFNMSRNVDDNGLIVRLENWVCVTLYDSGTCHVQGRAGSPKAAVRDAIATPSSALAELA